MGSVGLLKSRLPVPLKSSPLLPLPLLDPAPLFPTLAIGPANPPPVVAWDPVVSEMIERNSGLSRPWRFVPRRIIALRPSRIAAIAFMCWSMLSIRMSMLSTSSPEILRR